MSPASASVSLPYVFVSRADMAAVRGRLRAYQTRYAPFFGCRELRGHARAYRLGTAQRRGAQVHRAHGPAPGALGRRAAAGGAPGTGGGDAGRGRGGALRRGARTDAGGALPGGADGGAAPRVRGAGAGLAGRAALAWLLAVGCWDGSRGGRRGLATSH